MAYALWHAHNQKGLTKSLKKDIKSLMELQMSLEKRYSQPEIESRKSGMLCGFSGAYAVMAVMAKDLGQDPGASLAAFQKLAPAILKSGAKGDD